MMLNHRVEPTPQIHISPDSPFGSPKPTTDATADYYNDQFLDDLSIIDDIYSSYDCEQMTWAIDNRVANQNDALKEKMVQHLIQTESQFLGDMDVFLTQFAGTMSQFQVQKNKLAFCTEDCDILFCPIGNLIPAHRTLLDELRQRLSIYGPTQITSDIFYRFFDTMDTIYTDYMNSFSSSLLTLDRLGKTNVFFRFIETCIQSNPSLKSFGYYIRLPLTRLLTYTQTVDRCTQLTEPSHPDYLALAKITQKYKTRQNHWQSLQVTQMINDCLSHYKVYECFRLVQNSPALVTPTRRLLLHSELTHINPDLPTDLSDRRTYILYNDLLVFCKRREDKLHYQGIVILDQTVLKPLDSKLAKKIALEGQPPRKRSLFGIKKQPLQPEARGIFGLELFFQFIRDKDATTFLNPITNYGGGAVNNVSSSDSIRRHVLLTSSLEEQQLWMEQLQIVIKSIPSLR